LGKLLAVFIALAVLFGLLIGADLVVTHLATDELASHVKDASGAQEASASIGSFPVLYHFLADGQVAYVHVDLQRVPVGKLTLREVKVNLDGLRIARGKLFSQKTLSVKAIRYASVQVEMTAGELTRALGREVTLPGNGVIKANVRGLSVPVIARFANGDVFEVSFLGRIIFSQDLKKDPFVSSCYLGLHVELGRIVASCAMEPVPKRVISALDGQTAKQAA
jgi:hypothetical protein